MINLASIVLSPLFAQSFKVRRSQGEFGEGGWKEIAQVPDSFTMWGTIVPANERELKQVPEADRAMAGMVFYTTQQLYTTRNGQYRGISDKVIWNGEEYKILQCMPYSDYGFWKSTGQRTAGD